MNERKRIVIKVGSNLLVNPDKLTLRYAFMHGLLSDIASLKEEGYEVVLTSSGSAAIGLSVIGLDAKDAGVQDKQAAAACGQPLIINAYKQVALEYGFDIAQVLLTSEDMEDRRRFLNTKNTIDRLLDYGVVPIINENDTVTTEEIRVGDNDRLGAKAAQMMQARHFVILTVIDGLYDRNPEDPDAQFVEEIEDVSEYMEATSSGTSSLGTGGMLTKMQAANMAQNAGCTTYIGEGIIDRPISSIIKNERRHTKCLAIGDPQSSWRVWLTDRLNMAGSIALKSDAAEALKRGEMGVRHGDLVSVQGHFSKGEVLHIYDADGHEIARGLTNFSSDELILMARNPDEAVADLLGYDAIPKIITRDNLVILETHHLPWDPPTENLEVVSEED